MKNVLLKDIMVSPVISLKINDSFSKVEEKLRLKGIRHLPIIDDSGKVIGLITQRDFYKAVKPRMTEEGQIYDPSAMDQLILKHHMTKDPLTLRQEDSLARAVEIMVRNKFGCIPIVDAGKKLVGIVTETDVLKFVSKNLL